MKRIDLVGASSRAALAVALAVTHGGDREMESSLERLVSENPDGALPEPLGPQALIDALRAARASGLGTFRSADLREAQAIAKRFQLIG